MDYFRIARDSGTMAKVTGRTTIAVIGKTRTWHRFLLPIFLLYPYFYSCSCLVFRASAIVITP